MAEKHFSLVPLTIGSVALGVLFASVALPSGGAAPAAQSQDLLFSEIATVLRHPRCINCHTFTDFPRQGDEGRPHVMSVRRGADNRGRAGMECASCHQDTNQDEAGIPGAPGWALAPLSMGWEGLDDYQLAEALKDSARNGGRGFEELYHHMAHDPLVAWAWNPGGERQPPPIGHAEFAHKFRQWIDGGALSPAPGKDAP